MPHIHEKYDFVIAVYIVCEDRVLLVHHPKYGEWVPMGGHIELDEDPETALFREIAEETGLEVEILSDKPSGAYPGSRFLLLPNYLDVHDANPPHQHISFTYFARAKNRDHIQSEEHTDIHWLAEDDLEDRTYNLSESVKFYCREALKKSRERST